MHGVDVVNHQCGELAEDGDKSSTEAVYTVSSE